MDWRLPSYKFASSLGVSIFSGGISLFLHLGFVLVQRGIRTRDLKPVEEKILSRSS